MVKGIELTESSQYCPGFEIRLDLHVEHCVRSALVLIGFLARFRDANNETLVWKVGSVCCLDAKVEGAISRVAAAMLHGVAAVGASAGTFGVSFEPRRWTSHRAHPTRARAPELIPNPVGTRAVNAAHTLHGQRRTRTPLLPSSDRTMCRANLHLADKEQLDAL